MSFGLMQKAVMRTWLCRHGDYHGHTLDLKPIACTCSLGLVAAKVRWYRFDLMALTAGKS
jgi:hypothetical protein